MLFHPASSVKIKQVCQLLVGSLYLGSFDHLFVLSVVFCFLLVVFFYQLCDCVSGLVVFWVWLCCVGVFLRAEVFG